MKTFIARPIHWESIYLLIHPRTVQRTIAGEGQMRAAFIVSRRLLERIEKRIPASLRYWKESAFSAGIEHVCVHFPDFSSGRWYLEQF